MNFEYQVIRRPRRKTATISVNPDCSVRVVVPSCLSEQKVIDLVKRKSSWISGKLERCLEYREKYPDKEYVSGEAFSYLGKKYRLKVFAGDRDGEEIKLVNGRFLIQLPADMTKEHRKKIIRIHLLQWYRNHAITRLREKTRRFAKMIGVNPVSVGVKDYRSRWGGCHSDGRIIYNWRIIMAPHAVIDYVVVHELCHLVQLNHGKDFWRLVAQVLPDYTERRQWLHDNGCGLKM